MSRSSELAFCLSWRLMAAARARKDRSMGIRNPNREILQRLDSKALDARFLTEVEQGLSCSLFKAEAVLEVVNCVVRGH